MLTMVTNNQSHNKGLTFVEVLVVVALAGMIVSAAVSLQVYGVRTFRMGIAQAEMQRSARIIDAIIREQVRNAEDVGLDHGSYDMKLELEDDIFSFNEDSSVEVHGIKEIRFITEENDTNILIYTIIGYDNNFTFKNRILLNNATIDNKDESDTLYYTSPPQS